MECTLNASDAAAKALEDMRTGRYRITFGKRTETLERTRRSGLKHLALIVLVILPAIWMLTVSRTNSVRGTVTRNSEPLAHGEIIFRSREGKNHACESDEQGRFDISLPDGRYRIYRIEGKKKQLSPTSLSCSGDISIEVFFN